MTTIEKLLIEMLKIDSVSGNEKDLGNLIVQKLEGFKIKKQFIGKGRFNIIAKKGNSDVWLVGHLDTVPGAVPIRITKEKIYGRGACDNKGNLAGAILVGKKLKNINLLFTVGEEVDFAGAEKVKIKGSKIIVLEPTMLKVMTGQLGIIAYSISTKGKEKHTSLPFTDKENAIHEQIKICNYLREKNFNAFNVGKISGGLADNIVAGNSVMDISLRPKDGKEYAQALSIFKSLPKNFNCKVKLKHKYAPFFTNLTVKGETAQFFSEMQFFKNSLLFGAGNIKQAHANDEYVSRSQLNSLERELLKIIP
ncbi:MAG: M20/M25/M40 family metallo-hydrolase [Parcubacteria group bacterium]|jgi:acetylornithine deacetylase/succinyl-diaminopimelate desuccinylase-like protein